MTSMDQMENVQVLVDICAGSAGVVFSLADIGWPYHKDWGPVRTLPIDAQELSSNPREKDKGKFLK